MQRKDCTTTLNRIGGLALLIIVSATPASAATLELYRQSVVTGDDVRLGDLCRVDAVDPQEVAKLSALVVTVSPIAGGSLVISADEIRSALSHHDVNMATLVLRGSARCMVTKPAGLLSDDSTTTGDSSGHARGDAATDANDRHCLRDVIIEFLSAKILAPDARVVVQFGRANQDALDLCEPQFNFRIKQTSGRAPGMVGLEVTVFEDGDVVRTIPLLADASLVSPVLVATRAINLGAIVQADDIREVEMSFSRPELVGPRDPSLVIGQRAKRFIPAGQPIRLQELEPVPLVKRGQLVDVYSNVGGVSIVTAAQVLADGAYGDVVGLRSEGRDRRRFNGMVSGSGRVTIGGGETTFAMGDSQ